MKHERMEQPKYSIPERHAPKGAGTNAHGDSVHGSYKQPWVENDPTEPDKPEENIG